MKNLKKLKKKKLCKVLLKGDLNNVRSKHYIKYYLDHINLKFLNRINKFKKWEYGYNEDHDMIVIVRLGKLEKYMKYKT